jgi:hypothetical protein
VTYVYYSDEGHGFRRAENRRSFNAVLELFLAEHLGGRAEPGVMTSPAPPLSSRPDAS